MSEWLKRLIILLGLVVFLAPSTHAENANSNHRPLSESQIKKYLHSYPDAHAMANAYWGKRRFSPPNLMLPARGTFERAFEEMKGAKVIRDFDNLLQSHGFEDRNAWMQIGHRISRAYMLLRLYERDPARAILKRQDRGNQLEAIAEKRQELRQVPEAQRWKQLEFLQTAQDQIEREQLAESDAEVLKPYKSKFVEMNERLLGIKN